MSALRISVRAGRKAKTFTCKTDVITVGRTGDCDLVLPFSWLKSRHILIENGPKALQARVLSADAQALWRGRPLTTEWTVLPSPATIAVPTPAGGQIDLQLACVDGELETLILQDAGAGDGADDAAVPVLSTDRLAPSRAGWFGESSGVSEEEAVIARASAGTSGGLLSRVPPAVALICTAGLMLALIAGALAFNYQRRAVQDLEAQRNAAMVAEKLQSAEDLIRRKEYSAAKAALDAAETAARNHPARMAEAAAVIARLRERPEIRFGALGHVEMESRWLPADTARAWKAARERDDGLIDELRRKAAQSLDAGKHSEARLACDEGLALMNAHPVRPHPRYAEFKALQETIRQQSLASDMAARGYVSHQGRWVTPAQKLRMEQEAKGLVEYQGLWMTRAEMAEAQQKGGTGRVLYNGKWVSYEEKMQAEGYELFEGTWMKTDQKAILLTKRQEDAQREKERADAEKKAQEERQAQQAKAEALRKPAYEASQAFLKQQIKAASTQFPAFDHKDVHVLFDDGWYIVRASVLLDGTTRRRTYYCRLRPSAAGAWEQSTTVLAD